MRILIIGLSGAGKSTLAQRLSAKTGVPVYELDRLGWDSTGLASYADRLTLSKGIAGEDEWIAEGYIGWTSPLAEAADVIVAMRTNLRAALWRIFWRHLRAEMRRTNRYPGWWTLLKFMRSVARQYRSTSLPNSESDPLSSQMALDKALARYEGKVLTNPTVEQLVRFAASSK